MRAAITIFSNLCLLTESLQDFKAAIELFEHAKDIQDRELRRRWRLLSGRDGAVTIYNLGKAMEGIRASLKNCPSLNSLVDQSLLAESTQTLRTSFPRFEGIRHTVGHGAEFMRDEQSQGKHEFRGVMIANSLFEREFTATFEGKVSSYEISSQSAQNLQSAVTTMLSAFEQACILY